MKKISFLLVFQALMAQMLVAQASSPYRWRAGVDVGFVVGGGTVLAVGRLFSAKTEPLSATDLVGLKAENIRPTFDRRTVQNWSPRAAHTSDWLLRVGVSTPVGLSFSPKIRGGNALLLGAMAAETYLLTLGLTELTKNLARRTRPFTYNPAAPMSEKVSPDARRSFFSGHTSMSAAGCFFAAKVWSDFYPDSRWKPLVWGSAMALPALTAVFRVRAGKHFPTDVLVGYAVGALAGWLVPEVH